MKLPKALIGAVIIGLTAQAVSCVKKGDPSPKDGQEKGAKKGGTVVDSCPACGMG